MVVVGLSGWVCCTKFSGFRGVLGVLIVFVWVTVLVVEW